MLELSCQTALIKVQVDTSAVGLTSFTIYIKLTRNIVTLK